MALSNVLLYSIVLFFGRSVDADEDTIYAKVLWNTEEGGFRLMKEPLIQQGQEDDEVVAWGTFTNNINSTGWSFLEISTKESFPDKMQVGRNSQESSNDLVLKGAYFQAFAAGYLEGTLTAELIYMHWFNTMRGHCEGDKQKVCDKINDYLKTNNEWIQSRINDECPEEGDETKNCTSPYWHHVSLFYEQFYGLNAGYQTAVEDENISWHSHRRNLLHERVW